MREYVYIIAILIVSLSCQACNKKGASDEGAVSSLFESHYNHVFKDFFDLINENMISAKFAANLLVVGEGGSKYPRSIYYKDSSGVLADHSHRALSNIYVPANAAINESTWRIISLTEELEDRWIDVHIRHQNIGWQYITEKQTQVSRTYPWLDEVRNLGAYIDFTKVPQWQLISPENNPDRDCLCTGAYFDHDGLGNVISCACPIYISDEFVANMTVDIPLASYFISKEDIFDGSSKRCCFIMDRNGNVVYGTQISTEQPICSYFMGIMADGPSETIDEIRKHLLNCEETVRDNNGEAVAYLGEEYSYMCKKVPHMDGVYVMFYR